MQTPTVFKKDNIGLPLNIIIHVSKALDPKSKLKNPVLILAVFILCLSIASSRLRLKLKTMGTNRCRVEKRKTFI